MRNFALAAFVLSLPFFAACEQQKWEETKMFHEVPKKAANGHAPAPAAEVPAKPAH